MEHKRLLGIAAFLAAVVTLSGCSLGTGSLPIEEDFAGDCAWPEEENENAVVGCADGTYRLQLKRPTTQVSALQFGAADRGLRFEAQGTAASGIVPAGGAFGIGCWDEGDGADGDGYVFAVSPDGAYGILKDAKDDEDRRLLVDEGAGSVAVRDGGNRFGIECTADETGTTIAFSLNGASVGVVKDKAGVRRFGAVGFFAGSDSGGAVVTFDDASAQELSETEAASLARRPESFASRGTLPLSDDFSDPTSGWSLNEDQLVSLRYVAGKYRVALKGAEPEWSLTRVRPAASGLSVKASATKVAGPQTMEFGVVCYATMTQGYIFAVTTSGGWAIFKETPNDVVTVADGAAPGAFGGVGTPIEVEVRCAAGSAGQPTALALDVNGERVGRARDADGFAEFAISGFYAHSSEAGAAVDFDDFRAVELSQGEADDLLADVVPEPDTATPPRSSDVLYRDRFERKTADWPEDHSARSSVAYRDGGLHVTVRDPNNGYALYQELNARTDGVDLSVALGEPKPGTGQEAGISCNLDQGDGYSFTIVPDERQWRISKLRSTRIDELASGLNKAAVRMPPARNVLRALCETDGTQARLTLFVNGARVGEAVDDGGVEAFNSFALLADSGARGADITFDDLVASRPR